MAGRRVCIVTGCPEIIPSSRRRCAKHAAQAEKRRGTQEQRGYGRQHQALRASWKLRIERGEIVHCARCGGVIEPGTRWHLDHRDDRSGWLGPSHVACNTSAGAAASR